MRTSQASGVPGATLLPTRSVGLLRAWDQAGGPTGQGAVQCQASPKSQTQQLQAGPPLPAALATCQAELQVFLDQQFCKSLLLFIQQHRNAIFCQMFSRFSF